MAYLEITHESGEGRIILLDQERFLIGREDTCDLCLSDDRISREHVLLSGQADTWEVKDCDSKNGILVNGQKTNWARLAADDCISVGPVQIRFRLGSPSLPTDTHFDKNTVTRIVTGQHEESVAKKPYSFLLRVARIIEKLDSPEEVLPQFGQMLTELLQPTCCMLQFGKESWRVRNDGHDTAELSQSLINKIWYNGEAKLFSDIKAEADLCNVHSINLLGIRSAMGVPIIIDDKPVGYIYTDRRGVGDRPFTRDDLLVLIFFCRLLSASAMTSSLVARLVAEVRSHRGSLHEAELILGHSKSIKVLRQNIAERIGPIQSNVLLVGETGTGKNLIAKAIHFASDRRNGPFVSVNCAAIPQEQLESELFGHEKGAVPGADRRRIGQFEAASGGTLYLDEIGELQSSSQARLLKVLEERSLRRIGGTSEIDIDVRFIASTNRDLDEACNSGEFRDDLYYRLNVIREEIPPLRLRREDIAELANHFLERSCKEFGRRVPSISASAIKLLERYPWPGNIRELANCIERAVVYSDDGKPLDRRHLPAKVRQHETATKTERGSEQERQLIVDALKQSGGNKRKAARVLGWYPQRLYDRLKLHKIDDNWD